MRRFFAALVAVTLLIVVGVVSYFTSTFNAAFRNAYSEFETSRGGLVDSFEFATHGVSCGMSESKVNQVLNRAIKSRKMQVVHPKQRDNEFEKYYDFEYGPEFRVPIVNKRETLVSERFTVVFSNDDRAIRILRALFIRGDAEQTGTAEWDLCAKRKVLPSN